MTIIKTLLVSLLAICFMGTVRSQQKTFTVDFSATLERIKDLGGVNSGPDVLPAKGETYGGTAVKGYKDGGVSLIRTTHDVSGLQYFEYANTFWKDGKINPSYDPTLESSYRWTTADQKIDSIVLPGFTPYFRIGIGYDAAHGIYSAAPKDPDGINFTKFAEVCKRTVMHFNKDWPTGKGKSLGIKYWEVWNEPDGGFWRDSVNASASKPGDSVAFARMYKAVYDSMKSVDSTIKVGGPGVLSGSILTKREWTKTFLDECNKNNAKLDFFSWHLYGALNPYAIAIQGEYVRSLLHNYGFDSTESHVSELNIRLGAVDAANPKPLMNTPKHGAFTASSMISAQLGKIDKLLYFRGTSFMNLFGKDTLDAANPTLSGQGFKAFTELTRFAPQRIAADTSEFISSEASSQIDTTNIMILAGRSDDQKSCYVLISNYNSNYTTCTLRINNLPWDLVGGVQLKQTSMNSSGTMSETKSSIQAGASITTSISNFAAPAFTLLRFTYQEPTEINDNKSRLSMYSLKQNYPNPFNPITTIDFAIPEETRVTLTIYNQLGEKVVVLVNEEFNAGEHAVKWNAENIASGIYFCELKTERFTTVNKLLLLK